MYKVTIYEDHLEMCSDNYKWKWVAYFAVVCILVWAGQHYKKTGKYIETKIEEV